MPYPTKGIEEVLESSKGKVEYHPDPTVHNSFGKGDPADGDEKDHPNNHKIDMTISAWQTSVVSH